MKRLIGTAVLLLSSVAHLQAVIIPTVPVGNPGNANDALTGHRYGAVAYDYRIGTYEVTVGQYTEFLNAVAATDTYALYRDGMGDSEDVAGIAQHGNSGSFTYSVIGSPNKPAAVVGWGSAARFANWLHNGQPNGTQDASTTEDGAYALKGATSDGELTRVSRNAGAIWFIPSENEWYKAAYHQPADQGGDVDDYWEYPTRTNSEPNSDQTPGDLGIQTNVANFIRDDALSNGYNDGYAVTGSASWSPGQNYLTDVGAYMHSTSPYGTFDQGGTGSCSTRSRMSSEISPEIRCRQRRR